MAELGFQDQTWGQPGKGRILGRGGRVVWNAHRARSRHVQLALGKAAWGTGQVEICRTDWGRGLLSPQSSRRPFRPLPRWHAPALSPRRHWASPTGVQVWPLSSGPGHSPLPLPPATPTQTPGLSLKLTSPGKPPPSQGSSASFTAPSLLQALKSFSGRICVPPQRTGRTPALRAARPYSALTWAKDENRRRGCPCPLPTPRFNPGLLSLLPLSSPPLPRYPCPGHTERTEIGGKTPTIY